MLTAIVVAGEEIVWRGVAVDLASNAGSRITIGAISGSLYVVRQLVGGVPLLIVAATLLGSLLAAQRLVTGRLADGELRDDLRRWCNAVTLHHLTRAAT